MNKDRKEKLEREFTPNQLTHEQKSSLTVRVISAAVGTVIVLPCIMFGGWFFFALIGLCSVFAGYEIVHCAKKKYNPLLYIVTILMIACFAYWPIFRSILNSQSLPSTSWSLYSQFDTIIVSAVLIMVSACLLFFLVTIDKNFQVRDACYMLSFGIIVGLGLQCGMFIRYFPQYEYYTLAGNTQSNLFDFVTSACLLIYVVAGSLMCDAGAYFTGILFGKNKINERISPKKTWEGAIGGTVISFAFSLSFALIMAGTGNPIIGIFTLDKWYFILIISIIIPLVSQLGDFTFSSVKRYYGIKDYGKLMPGHGGILDRIDSVLFALIVSSILIIMFNNSATGEWWKVFI